MAPLALGAQSSSIGVASKKLANGLEVLVIENHAVPLVTVELDVKNGAKKLDGNTRARCGIFGRCQENFPATYGATIDSIRAVQAQSSSNLVDFFISKSNYARLRELTFTFDVPDRFAQKVNAQRASLAVSGRNLGMWTSYPGFEPEAMFLGGSRGGNAAWEQTTLPQLRTWIVSLNLSF